MIYLFIPLTLIMIVFIIWFCIRENIKEKEKIIEDIRSKILKLQEEKNIPEDFKKFPKYYINMDRSKDRREYFEKHMKDYKIEKYKRIKAIDGKKISNTKSGYVDGIKYSNKDKKCTKAELAITISHLLAIRQAKKDGCEVAMIMEDDCEMTLVPYWKKSITQIVEELPEDCDIFLLANRKCRRIKEIKIVKITNHQTGVCYLVTSRGMEKIEKYFSGENINLDLENIIFDQGMLESLNVYTYNITLFLLDSYRYLSTHYKNGKKLPDINESVARVLDNQTFIF